MGGHSDDYVQQLQELLCNAQQNASTWKGRVEQIARAMTRDGITKMAHDYALQIEDLFVRGGMSRDQRLLNIEKTFRRAISIASSGESYWND